tara:strand:+ start:2057 stop:2896 length:840 start_codon:yes stop_codon:yes gene_type:complete
MNYVNLTAKVIEAPKKLSFGDGSGCLLEIAPPEYGNYSSTEIELGIWGKKQAQLSSVLKGHTVFIEGAELYFTYNPETKIQSKRLKGGTVTIVPDNFPRINSVVLSGRCVNDTEQVNKDYKTFDSGFVTAKQRISVWNKADAATFYTFKANYYTKNKFGINYPDHIVNFLNKKHISVTIRGSIVTESWEDRNTHETRTSTLILIADNQGITLGNKKLDDSYVPNSKQKEPQKFQSVSAPSVNTNEEPEWSLAPKVNSESVNKPEPVISSSTNSEAEPNF